MPDVEEIGAVVAVTESEFERYAVELRQKLIEHLQRGDALRRTSMATSRRAPWRAALSLRCDCTIALNTEHLNYCCCT